MAKKPQQLKAKHQPTKLILAKHIQDTGPVQARPVFLYLNHFPRWLIVTIY